MKSTTGFFPGKTLGGELRAAMKRIKTYGVTYPPGYYRMLAGKYSKEGVRYPHILMIIGNPRINHHSFYPGASAGCGRILDYGCGTGDNVRQLIRDGVPRGLITAFDINRESIDLGFDLYRDRDEISDLFVVSDTFPFGPEEFDFVYSASVIHVIADERECRTYLANAYSALRPGGVFFGSTLGLVPGAARPPGTRGPPRLLTMEQLDAYLAGVGFIGIEIVRRYGVPAYIPLSEDLCVLEFCAKKQASSQAAPR